MKASLFSLAATSIPVVLADFWVVYQRRFEQIGRVEFTSYGTSLVRDVPQWTCEDDAFGHRILPDQRNASGDNYGVQFDPWSPRPGPLWHDPLVTVKMNMYPGTLGLQTISHDHDYAMRNVDIGMSGQCYLNRTFIFDLDCWFNHPDAAVEQFHVNINGSSMFFYESDIEVNEDIYSWEKSLPTRDSTILPPEIPANPPQSQG